VGLHATLFRKRTEMFEPEFFDGDVRALSFRWRSTTNEQISLPYGAKCTVVQFAEPHTLRDCVDCKDVVDSVYEVSRKNASRSLVKVRTCDAHVRHGAIRCECRAVASRIGSNRAGDGRHEFVRRER
jgi:hypothetical protein